MEKVFVLGTVHSGGYMSNIAVVRSGWDMDMIEKHVVKDMFRDRGEDFDDSVKFFFKWSEEEERDDFTKKEYHYFNIGVESEEWRLYYDDTIEHNREKEEREWRMYAGSYRLMELDIIDPLINF